ncbi:hypothetical protein QBC47DRAFT_386473 [Echria macrotheca]|uniref:Ribosomal protein S17 n=1 Tax=Echria macrotheca TaxID=438768 RepID=A0AAJ0BCT0_9PEZI|nr:hypothetical protein QBC47DRAFT_386473 [Echria macrotheca]
MASLATTATNVARRRFKELHGVVVTAGLMSKTVKVQVGGQKWNKFLQKYFNDPRTYLVHDPNDSLRAGDVVAIEPGWRVSKSKRHVVKHIVKPAGVPIEERPPIPTEEERLAERAAERLAKDERRARKKAAEAAESALERAERMLSKARKEVAARERMMGLGNPTRRQGGLSVESEVD